MFSCYCSAEYVGRTTRRLSQRMKEHRPAWLATGCRKSISSSIVGHLADTHHQIDPMQAFRVIHQVRGRQPRSVRTRILETAESLAVRLIRPVLNAQKQLAKPLKLPWPSTHLEYSSASRTFGMTTRTNLSNYRTMTPIITVPPSFAGRVTGSPPLQTVP